jgi:acyl-CoA dehydrogenase
VAKQKPTLSRGLRWRYRLPDWPFFEPRTANFAAELDAWARSTWRSTCTAATSTPPAARWSSALGAAAGCGTRRRRQYGGAGRIDTRAICLIRETLARHNGLADFAFAMQGLGSRRDQPVRHEQQERYLPASARGEAIAAFALSEPDAGSDVAAMQCAARIDGDHYVLNGEKTWISNGGIADFYVVFARTGEAPGARGISAFIVDAGTPGFEIAERIDVIAPHPLARLRFATAGCR